jgi:hypothetical protein
MWRVCGENDEYASNAYVTERNGERRGRAGGRKGEEEEEVCRRKAF